MAHPPPSGGLDEFEPGQILGIHNPDWTILFVHHDEIVNGVMLQGRVAAYDLFCMLLEREGYVQLAYKHAVSTIQPVTPVDLQGESDETDDD